MNVPPVRLDGGHALISSAVPADLRAGAIPADFREGFLVIRPEFMRFASRPRLRMFFPDGSTMNMCWDRASNIKFGSVTTYSSSRAASAGLQGPARRGADRRDGRWHPGRTLGMSQGLRNALPMLVLLAIGFAAPLLAVIDFSFHAGAHLQSVPGAHARKLSRHPSFDELHLVPVVVWSCRRHDDHPGFGSATRSLMASCALPDHGRWC